VLSGTLPFRDDGNPVGLLVNFNVPALREHGIRRPNLSSPPGLLASPD
jgi:hypothetical protein